MPIRPENAARYPKDWPAISAAIRARAGWRCEWEQGGRRCAACQYAVGHWDLRDGAWLWLPFCGSGPADAAGQGLGWPDLQRWTYRDARQYAAESYPGEGQPAIVIVLTVAHLDHQPENCDPANLRAWCQRHHLAYDHDHHRANAQATRRARAGTLELF